MRLVCSHQLPWSAEGLDAGVRLAGSSWYWVEPMELTEVDYVCQLGESVATINPGCRGSVCWSEINRKLRSVPGQWKSVRLQKCSEVGLETELGLGQNKTRWTQQTKKKKKKKTSHNNKSGMWNKTEGEQNELLNSWDMLAKQTLKSNSKILNS